MPDVSNLRATQPQTYNMFGKGLWWAAFLSHLLLSGAFWGCVSQPAKSAPPAPVMRGTRLPYTPQEFMKKLAAVMDGADSHAIPGKVEEVFGLKLKISRKSDSDAVTYYTDEWYSDMRVSDYYGSNPRGKKIGVSLYIASLSHPLNFGDATKGECLTSDLVGSILKADNWSGGPGGGEPLIIFYNKKSTHFSAIPTGSPGCIGSVRVDFVQSE